MPERSPKTALSEEDRLRIESLFKELDVDHDGRVSVSGLASVIQGDGRKETAKRIIEKKGNTGEQTLTFEEFVSYVKDTETHLKLAFKQLDRNNDNVVDSSEIQAAMRDLGVNVGLDEAEKLLQKMDKDGSLDIDYEEWRDFLLLAGTSSIEGIISYWKKASAVDIGDGISVPDDFTEEEMQSGLVWKTLVSGGTIFYT